MADILLVDDEPAVRWVVADLLSRLGHTCEQASDGQEALRLLRDREMDLIVSDVVMPRMDGFRLLEELRAEIDGRTPFLFLTGHDKVEDVQASLSCGAYGYVVKPCEERHLVSVVQRALEVREQWKATARPRVPSAAPAPRPVEPAAPSPVATQSTKRKTPPASNGTGVFARPAARVVAVPPPARGANGTSAHPRDSGNGLGATLKRMFKPRK